MVSTPGSGARSFRCKNAAARAERSPRIFTMCAISGARAAAGAGAAFGRSPGSPAAPASPRMAPPAPRRAPTAPRKRRRPSPSPREPSAGEGARCPARATGATAAAARSEAPAPVARARGRRPGAAGAAPRRAAADLCAGLAAGGDHFPGLGRRAASKARPCKRLLLRCAAGSSVSPTARHAARRIIEGYWTLSGALFFVSGNWYCESVTVGARRDFFFARTAQPFGRVRTPGTDQTTRKRVSRRSTSNKRGTPDRRAVNIVAACGQPTETQ